MKNEKQRFCNFLEGAGGQIRFIMGDVQVANRTIELCFIKGISVILTLRCGIWYHLALRYAGFHLFRYRYSAKEDPSRYCGTVDSRSPVFNRSVQYATQNTKGYAQRLIKVY